MIQRLSPERLKRRGGWDVLPIVWGQLYLFLVSGSGLATPPSKSIGTTWFVINKTTELLPRESRLTLHGTGKIKLQHVRLCFYGENHGLVPRSLYKPDLEFPCIDSIE